MDAAEKRRRRRTSIWRRIRDMQQHSPSRPLDWRSRLAEELVERDVAAPPRCQDPALHDAIQFQRQLVRAKSPEQYQRVHSESPIGQACLIVMTSDERKTLLEASLLTGEPLAEATANIGRASRWLGRSVPGRLFFCRSRSFASQRLYRPASPWLGAWQRPIRRVRHACVCLLWWCADFGRAFGGRIRLRTSV